MQYLAICGRQPELSAAELFVCAPKLHAQVTAVNDRVLLVEAGEQLPAYFPQLGGFVKLGEVVRTEPTFASLMNDMFLRELFTMLPSKGKIVFGVSVYGPTTIAHDAQQLLKRIKMFLAENNRPARFILGERGVLSSVVVDKEKMISRGAELLIAVRQHDLLIARTIAVQPYEELSGRDYGRPRRNAASGMIPPKLARVMLHCAGIDAGSTLLDPFCGSGTILQEAVALGCKRIIGADIAIRAIQESQENLQWFGKHEKRSIDHVVLHQADVRGIGKILLPESVDMIVTEPYLGPPLRGGEDLTAVRNECSALYERAFHVFARVLRHGGRVVFLFPVFYENEKPRFIMNLDAYCAAGFRIIQPLSPELMMQFRSALSYRNTIVYRRPGQRVGRELIVFQRM